MKVFRVAALAVLWLMACLTTVLADTAPKPDYVATDGTCTDAAVEAKFHYVMGLYKQYSDDDAPGLTDAQVNRIWDSQGLCHGKPTDSTLSRNSITRYITTDYFGSYMSAEEKYRVRKYSESRYFAEEFSYVEWVINDKAKTLGWDNWIAIDAPISKKMKFLEHLLNDPYLEPSKP